ncbi:TetR/AcrR family transcriptional regulator [Actinomadura sp. NTSP31]|uniref:TetR/AcrR family transcriptional regulator n=1 Tax=Actinomadura sp. NTSP31 TaxID=1735447 RepID=UPI0035C18488
MQAPGQAVERVRIIDAAYRCLAAADGAPVTTGDIVAAAGLPDEAFGRHFESRDALLLTMFRRDGALVTAEMRSWAASAASPPEALRALVDGMLRITADDRRRRRALALTSEEATRARGCAEVRARAVAEQEALIAEILAAGLADGSLPWADPEPDARSARAALGRAFEHQLAGTARESASAAAAQLTAFLFRALGVRSANGRAMTNVMGG